MRESVDVVPAELLGEEVFHASSPDELREGTRKTEAVGKPGDFGRNAEPRAEVPLTVDHLTSERFSRRHVRVVFHLRPEE